jgi:hypothetical protein
MEIDSITAFLAVLLTLFLMMNALNDKINERKEIRELIYLKSKAILYADTLIKNSNQGEPEKGIAFYNKQKKRVEENVIDLKLVKKIKEEHFERPLKQIKITFDNETINIGEKKGKCFEAKRFIVSEKGKGVISVYACG